MKIKIVFFLCLCLSETDAFSNCNGAWDIWLIPEKYKISDGESIRVRFGITGYGTIDIYNSKFCIYSEKETRISIDGDTGIYEIYTSLLTQKPEGHSVYDINYPDNIIKGIGLKSDYLTEFKDVISFPKTTGDKKLVFVFTYKCGEEWKIISKEFNYHVNTWSEDHETWLNIFYLLGAILTILTLTPDTYISRFFKRISLKKTKHTPHSKIQTAVKNSDNLKVKNNKKNYNS